VFLATGATTGAAPTCTEPGSTRRPTAGPSYCQTGNHAYF